MRLLIVTQYFWPENFRINDLALGLHARGHEVTVLTGKPNYPAGRYFEGYGWWTKPWERWQGISIHRCNLILRKDSGGLRLFLNFFSFAASASFKVLSLRGNFDRVLIFAPSPITQGIPGVLARWRFGARNYLWVHDLWPESIRVAGNINNRTALALIDWMTQAIYWGTHKILIQSKGFESYLLAQKVPRDKILYYPFYAEDFYRMEQPNATYASKMPAGFRLIFAGNIGEAQSFGTLLAAAHQLQQHGLRVQWVIFGDGRMKGSVNRRVAELGLKDSFHLMGSVAPTEMPKFFACADGLIVSLKRSSIFSITIPGKLQSYLACGKPLVGSLDGVGAQIIQDAKCGFVSEAESAEGLTKSIISLYHLSAGERDQLGRNARAYYEREFEREILLTRLEDIFLRE